MRFMRVRAILGLFLLIFNSWGCASLGVYNAATGRREFIIVPTSEEVSMGKSMHGQVTGQYKLLDKDPRLARVQRVGARVAQVSDRQDYEYHFYLLDSPELNAFTTPGGNIYVLTGLLAKMQTDDELAAVLAHEIGHCAARHTIKKFQGAVGYEILGTLLLSSIQVDSQVKKIASMGSDALMQVVFSAYSRQDEMQADKLGVKYLDLSGYNPQGMVDTLEILAREEKGGQAPLFLRTHPYLKDRVIAVKDQIAHLPKG